MEKTEEKSLKIQTVNNLSIIDGKKWSKKQWQRGKKKGKLTQS